MQCNIVHSGLNSSRSFTPRLRTLHNDLMCHYIKLYTSKMKSEAMHFKVSTQSGSNIIDVMTKINKIVGLGKQNFVEK